MVSRARVSRQKRFDLLQEAWPSRLAGQPDMIVALQHHEAGIRDARCDLAALRGV
jgi:hypothetical protein